VLYGSLSLGATTFSKLSALSVDSSIFTRRLTDNRKLSTSSADLAVTKQPRTMSRLFTATEVTIVSASASYIQYVTQTFNAYLNALSSDVATFVRSWVGSRSQTADTVENLSLRHVSTYGRSSSTASTDSATMSRSLGKVINLETGEASFAGSVGQTIYTRSMNLLETVQTSLARLLTQSVNAVASSSDAAAFSRSQTLNRVLNGEEASTASFTRSVTYSRALSALENVEAIFQSTYIEFTATINSIFATASSSDAASLLRELNLNRNLQVTEEDEDSFSRTVNYFRQLSVSATDSATAAAQYIAYAANTFYIFATAEAGEAATFARTLIFNRGLQAVEDSFTSFTRGLTMFLNPEANEETLISAGGRTIRTRILAAAETVEATFIGTFILGSVDTFYIFADAVSGESASFIRSFGGRVITTTITVVVNGPAGTWFLALGIVGVFGAILYITITRKK